MNKPIYKFMCLCQVGKCKKNADYMIYKDHPLLTSLTPKEPMYYFCKDHVDRELDFLNKIYSLKDIQLSKVLLTDIESGMEAGW